MAGNPLDEVMEWFQTARDAIRVTERIVTQKIPRAIIRKHRFHGQSEAACCELLTSSLDKLTHHVILGLTAIFERTLRDHLRKSPVLMAPTGDPHLDGVRSEILKDIEFWNLSARVVELFPSVDGNVRGLVRQIIEYRNWVAHGHSLGTSAPLKLEAIDAHRNLTTFLVQAGVISP